MRCWTAKPWVWTLTHLTVTQEFLLLFFSPFFYLCTSICSSFCHQMLFRSTRPGSRADLESGDWQVYQTMISEDKAHSSTVAHLCRCPLTCVLLWTTCWCVMLGKAAGEQWQRSESPSMALLIQLRGGGVRQRPVTVGEGRLDTKVCWSLQLRYVATSFPLHVHLCKLNMKRSNFCT